MSIAEVVRSSVKAMPPGQVFGYRELPSYDLSSTAVVSAVNRLVSDKKLQRLSKGKFYVPQKGLLGPRKPSDNELLRSILYKGSRQAGYITGLALYNRLGLTTQVPRTVTIAVNGGRQEKNFGTIRVKLVRVRPPIREQDVKLLQYLDVLQGVKAIPDTDVNSSLKMMKAKLSELSGSEIDRLVQLAIDYYGAQARSLAGLLLSATGATVPARLRESLNPTTVYRLALDKELWPQAKDWKIQ